MKRQFVALVMVAGLFCVAACGEKTESGAAAPAEQPTVAASAAPQAEAVEATPSAETETKAAE